MSEITLVTQLKDKFGDGIVAVQLDAIDAWVEVTAAALIGVCEFLRDIDDYHFDMCNCITAIDYLHTDAKKAEKVDWAPHFELVYHLSSIATKLTLVVKVKIPRWKDEAAQQLPEISSVAGVLTTSIWHDRDVYVFSGVSFFG
nr:NADH-quinone oxidoreductase subunit C [Planctomycetota bacterium]